MKKYRVVAKDNAYLLPFPDESWPTREQAQRFADTDAPDGWAGKLTVVEIDVANGPEQVEDAGEESR